MTKLFDLGYLRCRSSAKGKHLPYIRVEREDSQPLAALCLHHHFSYAVARASYFVTRTFVVDAHC